MVRTDAQTDIRQAAVLRVAQVPDMIFTVQEPWMEPRLIAILILLPFVVAFVYAVVHEYRRYNSEGKMTYGLAYDEETGTTHVTGIPDHEESFDLDEFDPNGWNGFGGQVQLEAGTVPETEAAEDTGSAKGAEGAPDAARPPAAPTAQHAPDFEKT
jgi:hypothetical protein